MNGEPSLGNNTFFQLFYYNPNNILTATQQSSAGLNSKTYTYVYNEEGYPTSVEESTHYHNGTTNTIYRSWFYETY